MIGGILSNNASGMCCGVSRNSYHTTRYLRFILPNGKCYSTENEADYQRFQNEYPEICEKLNELRGTIASSPVDPEIGRATGRERVLQYGSISGVAVS